jgi:hypothetical protein
MNPEVYSLSLINWQFFVTLTFKSEKLSVVTRLKMFFALARTGAKNFGIHFPKLIWCLRSERGESTGRLHYHVLFAGFPKHALTTATCFSLMKQWEGFGGGIPRCSLYSSKLDGVGYVLKGCSNEFDRASGDFYEAKKFGLNCDVMLSESIFHVLKGRRGYRRDAATRSTQSGVDRGSLGLVTVTAIT